MSCEAQLYRRFLTNLHCLLCSSFRQQQQQYKTSTSYCLFVVHCVHPSINNNNNSRSCSASQLEELQLQQLCAVRRGGEKKT
ncbi:hypothetical protein Pmani_038266 [Petrolisthes manimaculis]|uniref:Uncharacterized protein n=1 Tax=Petrolisthes manimaculis TaxID=1843537 RepID=A0AAE1NGK4_9EUCA|nr:hypothetical protein Pmani_038266 [Petrolisthes manimaculis]